MFWETDFEKTSFLAGMGKSLEVLYSHLEHYAGIDTDVEDLMSKPENKEHAYLISHIENLEGIWDYFEKGKAIEPHSGPATLNGLNMEELPHLHGLINFYKKNITAYKRHCSRCGYEGTGHFPTNPKEKDPDKMRMSCPHCGRVVHYI